MITEGFFGNKVQLQNIESPNEIEQDTYRFSNPLAMEILKNIEEAIQEQSVVLHQLIILRYFPWG